MKTGLILSGGGMRGAAHIGAIKALEEYGIVPTHIAGTSAGAIVGALYAYGYNWEEILTFFKEINLLDFKRYALNKPGIIDAEKFYSAFKTYLANDNFSHLKKELSITTTNILNGKLEIFNSGELIKPVLASAAIPGIFSPVKINESYYVDGGTLNNFPVELLKSSCEQIIGIYVNSFNPISMDKLKYAINVIERAFIIKSVDEDSKKFKDCDLIVLPQGLNKYGVLDKKYLNEIFNIGYEATMKALEKNTINFK
ncbi:patatin-like phospholipase family protein [Mariniflexile sp.]|uniref:patatin-like phospholipase family protein n=1 Tax=Mariniflexile sp. TaxID=1979402 RepID=UPI0035613BF3